jgi:glutamyl-tRNA synthetase
MRVTHVIRGDDHLNNTPRQLNMLKALGATPPVYAHVPMILGADGSRLSKRHGAVSVMQYRDEGYLPEALLNYLARLGWSHGDQEIFSIEEMVKLFEVEKVHSSAAAFNPEKLLWLNQHYIKTGDPAHVARHLSFHLGRLGIDPSTGPDSVEIVKAQRERAKTLVEMAQNSVFFYADFSAYDPKDGATHLTRDAKDLLVELRERLKVLAQWSAPSIHACITVVAETRGVKMGKVAQPLRVAVAGRAMSPPIDVTLELLGTDKTLGRIDKALQYIEQRKD